MKTKVCFKCQKEKLLSEFYKHAEMGDGHLNKCKYCTRRDTKDDYYRKRSDEDWREAEKLRQRNKYQRLNYKEKQKEWNRIRPWTQSGKYKGLCKKYRKIKNKNEILHHWSYKDEHLEDIFILDRCFHGYIHRFLDIIQDGRYFKGVYPNGQVYNLDTREKHSLFLEAWKQVYQNDKSLVV